MAKRRNLKKNVDYLCDELLLETLSCINQPEIDETKYTEILERIDRLNLEFRNRIQGSSVKADSKQAKQYYRQVCEDFETEAGKIYAELKSLNEEKSEN